jgi:flagellar hook-length control protein FliK
MDVNVIGGTSGAGNAANAAAQAPVDAALFQNLIAAALLQKSGTTALPADAANAEKADIGLLMKLLQGGGAYVAEGLADGAESVLPDGESLLLAITSAPADALIAASGRPEDTETAELIADVGAILNALETSGARASAIAAADGPVNNAAVETILANGEAAETPLRPALAKELSRLVANPAADEARTAETPARTMDVGTAEAAVLAKAARIEAPPADGETARVTQAVSSETAVLTRETADAEAKPAIDARAVLPGTGASEGRPAAESAPGETAHGNATRGDAAETGATSAAAATNATHATNAAYANPQDGIATGPGANVSETAQGTAYARPEPYGQIANEIFAALAGKKLPTTLSMRLEPAELGRVDVNMRLTAAGKLVIDIAAESAKTRALLAGQTDKLVQALGLQNVQVESVNATNGAALSGQQQAWAYADRSMAFFMDLAGNGAREDRADRDGEEKASQVDRTVAGISEAAQGAAEKPAQYARRLDLTA